MITPRIKKPGLDRDDVSNYRPISNLTFISKVMEKIVAKQLIAYLASNNLMPRLQSGFRSGHSTETAILRVLSDIYSSIDQGQVALLALLDVSAAFDTVDHDILLERLSKSFGITRSAHHWIRSFLTSRTQTVHVGISISTSAPVRWGVQKGSVLGPLHHCQAGKASVREKRKATESESDRIRYRKFCREANKKIVGAREEFYKERIHAAASDPRRRWSEIRNVLNMTTSAEVLPPEECQGRCDRFVEFFVGKVRSVKQAVSDKVDSLVGGRMDPLFHDHAHVGPDFAELEPPSIDDVKKILGSIPGKSSNMDAIPTSLLKSCADIFAPLIARLAALSFRDGQFPSWFKIASVTPLLKKPGLASEVPGNYRPISNLNNISKILERLFLRNIIDHVSSSPSFNSSQSAYRKDHSTETALLRLLNDIYCAADRKSRSLLILRDQRPLTRWTSVHSFAVSSTLSV